MPATQVLHEGLLGTRLTGTVSKWTGRYGFVRIDDYTQGGRVLLTVTQFKDEGAPIAGMRVSFTLDRNEKGWKAVNCRRIHEDRECLPGDTVKGSIPSAADNGTSAADAPSSTAASASASATASPVMKFPIQYDHNKTNQDLLAVFEQSMQLFNLLSGRTPQKDSFPSPFSASLPIPRSKLALAGMYKTLMAEFSQDIEDKEVFYPRLPFATMRDDWERIKEIQSLKGNEDAHKITLKDLQRLNCFQEYLQCPVFSKTMKELLNEYAEHVSMNATLPAFAKAAWVFVHLRQIVTNYSNKEDNDEEEDAKFHSVYLMMNWVLLQQGVPFMADSVFPEAVLCREVTAVDSQAIHNWLLFCLTDMCRDFDKRMNYMFNYSSSVPEDPEKIVNNHRKTMLESEDCFLCREDAHVPEERCTVSLLCCGRPAHARCLQNWRKSPRGYLSVYKDKCFVGPCPGCHRNCLEPLIEKKQSNQSRSEVPRPDGLTPLNNNDDDEPLVSLNGDDDGDYNDTNDNNYNESELFETDEERPGYHGNDEDDFDDGYEARYLLDLIDDFDDDM